MPEPTADRQQELDAEVEDLARRIAAVVNSAGPEARQNLREYAVGLLKEETEISDAGPTPAATTPTPSFNPLAIALLLVLVSLPLLLSIVFAYVGFAVLAVAAVMALWGVLAIVIRR